MSAQVVTCSKIIATHTLESRQPLYSYTFHRGIVNAVSINHTGKVIASCGQDGKIILVANDKPESKLLDHNFYPNVKPTSLTSCAFSPSSKYIAVGSVDSLVKVWDLRGQNNTQKENNIMQIRSHMCGVTSLAWLKKYRNEIAASEVLASSSSSGDIYLHANKEGTFVEVTSFKMQEGINCLRVSETGNEYCKMAACTNGGTLAVWDLISGKDRPAWTTTSPSENKSSMTSLSISSYSPVLLVTASVDETLTFFDIHQKKSVKKITAQEPLSCVGLHANGHTLVAGGMYGNCFVYDLRNPSKPQNKLAGHDTTIKHLEFFTKGKEKEHLHNIEVRGKAPSVVNNKDVSNASQPIGEKMTTVGSSSNVSVPVEIKSKENIKIEPKMNNFIGSSSERITDQFDKRNATVLSATGQQAMKRHAIKNQTSVTELHKQTYPYRHSQQYPKHEQQVPIRLEPPPSSASLHRETEFKQLKQQLGEVKSQLKQVHSAMFDMQERINLSLVRQFQLHEEEMRKMLNSIVSKEKEKDDYIKRLQQENARLKNNTF